MSLGKVQKKKKPERKTIQFNFDKFLMISLFNENKGWVNKYCILCKKTKSNFLSSQVPSSTACFFMFIFIGGMFDTENTSLTLPFFLSNPDFMFIRVILFSFYWSFENLSHKNLPIYRNINNNITLPTLFLQIDQLKLHIYFQWSFLEWLINFIYCNWQIVNALVNEVCVHLKVYSVV